LVSFHPKSPLSLIITILHSASMGSICRLHFHILQLHLCSIQRIPCFLWLNNVIWCMVTTLWSSIHLSMMFRLTPCPTYCEWCCNKHGNTGDFSRCWFCFLWVYAQQLGT
jgi:hypothetical protein